VCSIRPLSLWRCGLTSDRRLVTLAAANRFVRPWPHLIHASTSQPQNGISIDLVVFAYSAAKASNAFQWGGQPQKIVPSHWGIGAPANTWFLGPTRLSTPKRHLNRFSRFRRAHSRDRSTDHGTNVIQPNNNNTTGKHRQSYRHADPRRQRPQVAQHRVTYTGLANVRRDGFRNRVTLTFDLLTSVVNACRADCYTVYVYQVWCWYLKTLSC